MTQLRARRIQASKATSGSGLVRSERAVSAMDGVRGSGGNADCGGGIGNSEGSSAICDAGDSIECSSLTPPSILHRHQ